jgi:hypothetical protein
LTGGFAAARFNLRCALCVVTSLQPDMQRQRQQPSAKNPATNMPQGGCNAVTKILRQSIDQYAGQKNRGWL